MKCGIHIRVNVLDAGEKPLEHLLHRVVQVADIFLHRLLEVLRSQVCGGDDRQRRFQLCGHILFEASGRQLDIPEWKQHKAHCQYGDEEGVPGKDGSAGAKGKQHQGGHAHHGEFSLPPGCGQYRLGFRDLPTKETGLFPLGCLVDIRPDAARSGSQPGEDAVAHFCRGDPQHHKKPGDHAHTGNQLDGCHADASFLWINCSSSLRDIPFSMKRRCRLSDSSSHFW